VKILITGAGGLLGSEIYKTLELKRDALGISDIIRQRKNAMDGYVSVDLSIPEGVGVLTTLDWDVVIHTAAAKDPDFCEINRVEAEALNVAATRALAAEAASRHARVIYICTDYVFPGTNPPYAENAPPCPINFYGKTKLAGEEAVMEASSENCSLRVPILYGLEAGVKHSALLSGSLKTIIDQGEKYIDDVIIRYPTCTSDVAAAILFLLGRSGKGIFHCSGEDRQTKYGICVALAEMLGLSYDHIKPLKTIPESAAPRPEDSHLSCRRLREMGFDISMSFGERIKSYESVLRDWLTRQ